MFLRKYGTGTGADVIIPIIKRGVVDFAVSADWTPASGDVKVSKDGGTEANIATLPVINGTVGWKFVFSDAELQCKSLTVRVVDSATKAIEDQFFIVETYGDASAMFQADLSAANLPANVVQISGDSTAADNLEAAADGTGYNLGAGQIVASSVSGAVGSVTGAVGSVTGNVGGNLSGNVSGNVSGSVGSVTGAVGSVTGSVGSVVGSVGGSVASVAGAVGSVTGNVGGDVSGKVLGGGSGTISGDGVRAASVTGAVGSVTGSVGSVVGEVELDSSVAAQITAIETFATRMTTAISQDGLVWQFTTNALENAPSGGGGGSATLENQETIIEMIDTYLVSITAAAQDTPGTIAGFPATLNIGDSYTDALNNAITVTLVDDNDDPVDTWGDYDVNHAGFTPTLVISGSGGKVTATVTYDTDHFLVEIPSSESLRASPGTATMQFVLKWYVDGRLVAQKTIVSGQAVTWVKQI